MKKYEVAYVCVYFLFKYLPNIITISATAKSHSESFIYIYTYINEKYSQEKTRWNVIGETDFYLAFGEC